MSYYALISSLPMLTLDGNAGMTPERFLSACEMYVKGEKYWILQELGLDPSPDRFKSGTLPGNYAAWECALRNAIVRSRANKLDRDPGSYLNRAAGTEGDTERAVSAAWATANPLERERILDQARWMKIEELESGFPFSFERLCAYKLKMLLQLKWLGRVQEHAAQNLEDSANAVVSSIEMKTKQEN